MFGPVVALRRSQALWLRQRPGGTRKRHAAHQREVIRIQRRTVHHGIRVGGDVRGEEPAVGGQWHDLRAPFEALVVGQAQRRLDDHAQRAIAADRAVEKFAVAGRAGVDDGAIGQRQPDRRHARHDGPLPDIAAMGIHAERAAHGEVGERLHYLQRQVVRIDDGLDVAPRDARLDRDEPLSGVQAQHPVEAAHVEVQ